MSSHRGSNNGGGAGVQSIPPAARKIVQSLKEIVNRPELEIYATLKDSHMDPDEAVNRLLSQGPSLSISIYLSISISVCLCFSLGLSLSLSLNLYLCFVHACVGFVCF